MGKPGISRESGAEKDVFAFERGGGEGHGRGGVEAHGTENDGEEPRGCLNQEDERFTSLSYSAWVPIQNHTIKAPLRRPKARQLWLILTDQTSSFNGLKWSDG
jgi:hypothetical protein